MPNYKAIHSFELTSSESRLLWFPSRETPLCIPGTSEDKLAGIWIVKLGTQRSRGSTGDCPMFSQFHQNLNFWFKEFLLYTRGCTGGCRQLVPQMFMKCVICKSDHHFPVGLVHTAKYNFTRYPFARRDSRGKVGGRVELRTWAGETRTSMRLTCVIWFRK